MAQVVLAWLVDHPAVTSVILSATETPGWTRPAG
jgi:aryl-alcohol dehydrogenase-like predicted oxidoreductase